MAWNVCLFFVVSWNEKEKACEITLLGSVLTKSAAQSSSPKKNTKTETRRTTNMGYALHHVGEHNNIEFQEGKKNNIPTQNCLFKFSITSSAILNLITPSHKAWVMPGTIRPGLFSVLEQRAEFLSVSETFLCNWPSSLTYWCRVARKSNILLSGIK